MTLITRINVQPTAAIEDVQARPDRRRIAIDRVGVKDLAHPVRVLDRSGQAQHTVARFNMYVHLSHDFKGTHMSRFVELLNRHEHEVSVASFRALVEEMTQVLGSESGHVEMRFPFFVRKRAPVTRVESLMNYEASLIGEHGRAGSALWLRVEVPVTSLCPCSKDISDYGAHNQRSRITLTVRPAQDLWLEELIEIAESEASCEVYGILKRPDEKFVTERAYDNPKFVEDLVRDLAGRLEADPRILAYTIEAENLESIHNHSAYARIDRDKDLASDNH